jgi:hypothetical protein
MGAELSMLYTHSPPALHLHELNTGAEEPNTAFNDPIFF